MLSPRVFLEAPVDPGRRPVEEMYQREIFPVSEASKLTAVSLKFFFPLPMDLLLDFSYLEFRSEFGSLC